MKNVYRIDLDGNVGYYRAVGRMKKSSVKKEAQRMYPLAKVNVMFQPDMTELDCKTANGKIIDRR